jgi:hypothetical protein
VIEYTITVENTGNVTIDNIVVSDPNADAGSLSCDPVTILAPGESFTCTATHTITQAELDLGQVSNVATADGQDPNDNPVTDDSDDPNDPTDNDPDQDGEPDDPTVTMLDQTPELQVFKTDELLLGADNLLNAGDLIEYTITVENTGNVTIDNIVVTDPNADAGSLSCDPVTILAPGESFTCTATYTIMPADIINGMVSNVATADGQDTNDNPVSDDSDDPDDPTDNDPDQDGEPDDPTVTMLEANPELQVFKTDELQLGADNELNAGDVIEYTITVRNTGNVVVDNITVSDPNADAGSLSCDPVTMLAPGEEFTCTAIYTITEADILAGQVVNVATADGFGPGGDPVSDDSDDPDDPTDNDPDQDGEPDDPTVTMMLVANPELQVFKTDELLLGTDNILNAGDVIKYTITVENTGNVTIDNITVIDPNADAGSLSCDPVTILAPGESFSCVAEHTITQGDLDARQVVNVATARGQDPNDNPVTDDSDDPNDPTDNDPDQDGEPDDPTVTEFPCVTIEAWVYLEGAAIFSDGSENYNLPMRTDLNDLRLLPGQTFDDLFDGPIYNPAQQPYNQAPWNYFGTEGDAYDSGGDLNFADAGYPSTVVDWVLVSLRTDPNGTGGPLCQAAALLHNDGRIEFVEEFACCNLDLTASYYLVIEHRNHLIVMSHEAIPILDGKITYDFRVQQTYIDDPFEFGIFVGQKEILPGVFAMFGGNGNQTLTGTSDTDINFDDRTFWEGENGIIGRYKIGDYNLNGDVNFNDRRLYEINNGRFTSVPRD